MVSGESTVLLHSTPAFLTKKLVAALWHVVKIFMYLCIRIFYDCSTSLNENIMFLHKRLRCTL